METKEKMTNILEKGGEGAESLLMELGLTAEQSRVLAAGFSMDGDLTPEAISEETGMSVGTAFRVLDELKMTGLLGSSEKVRITRRGRKLVENNVLI